MGVIKISNKEYFGGEDLELNIGQFKVICECLNIAKETLMECKPANYIAKLNIERKIKQIEAIMPLVEKSANYNFKNSVEKCKSKQSNRDGDVGEDTFVIMANRKGNTPKKEENKKEAKKTKKR